MLPAHSMTSLMPQALAPGLQCLQRSLEMYLSQLPGRLIGASSYPSFSTSVLVDCSREQTECTLDDARLQRSITRSLSYKMSKRSDRSGFMSSKISTPQNIQFLPVSGVREMSFTPAQVSEVKMESQVIFDFCWRKMEEKYGQDYWAPREIVWLNGAPGSGKGVNTPHILKVRGLNRSVTISSLLCDNQDAKALMDRGDMVPESVVGDALLDAVFNPDLADRVGVLVDGFPRTASQVDFVKLLFDKLQSLHNQYADTPFSERFPRVSFKLIMLYVDEETSLRRQLQRAELAYKHNRRVLDAGGDQFREQRMTDADIQTCKKRYEIFRTHYATVLRLKQFFFFTLIDSMGTPQETRDQISRELRYQSSMDLEEATYAAIRHIPLARQLVKSARQKLVDRLDSYCLRNRQLFDEVIKIIDEEVLPLLRRAGLAGHAEYTTDKAIFSEQPMSIDMLIDVLTDRGFGVHHCKHELVVPLRFDPVTGVITSQREPNHSFHITFDVKGVREMMKAIEIATQQQSMGLEDTQMEPSGITRSFIPQHADHSLKMDALRAQQMLRGKRAMAAFLSDRSSQDNSWSNL